MYHYQAPTDLLKAKTLLVTGAGDGIGRAAAMAYAAHGATVILLGRTLSKLENVYDEIASAGGPQAVIHPLDLQGATEQHYDELALTIEEQFGCLDGLLHNASLLGGLFPIQSYDPETWNKVIQVNLNAPYMLTKSLLPVLHIAQQASIIFTSSSVGRKGRAFWGAYSASKFAVEGLMQILAEELQESSSIRVNCINPGATQTSMRKMAFPAENPNANPIPEDIMNVYLHLMGKDSLTVTGQSLDAQT